MAKLSKAEQIKSILEHIVEHCNKIFSLQERFGKNVSIFSSIPYLFFVLAECIFGIK